MRIRYAATVLVLAAIFFCPKSSRAEPQPDGSHQFSAGAAVVDVTPQELPVIRNGGFLEAVDSRIADPLHARAIVLSDGRTRIAIVVVDSCMIPVDVCDQAKSLAQQLTGINVNRMMVSATHTHSAPSVMDYCLGSRADKAYREFLPGKIAEAVKKANDQLQPAKIGFTTVDASTHTKCRRYITRSDKFGLDPFGERTVHAMMHPGHVNPDYIGPSGPIDPWLSLMSIRSSDGKPLALFANFSMHYFGGHPGISADYYGRFCNEMEKRIAPDRREFVGLMSQGTSGDLWWGDYSVGRDKKPFRDIEQFVSSLADLAERGLSAVKYRSDVSLGMTERRLKLPRRTPNEARLAWARRLNALRGNRPPKDRPEVYAKQAVHLHENPTDEVVLQAIRIGDIAITGMPNEVYGLTGLKLKRQSPFESTFNISLANGACGYIPPPEQHELGGYTTWPATTAGLEKQAEPKIVGTLLNMLEQVSGKSRRKYVEPETDYSRSIVADDPVAYWRFSEMAGRRFANTIDRPGRLSVDGEFAHCLPGRTDKKTGDKSRFDSHAVQLAGGKLLGNGLALIASYTVEMSFRLGAPADYRPVTGTLLSHGSDRLSIAGNAPDDRGRPGRLKIGEHVGSTTIVPGRWYHLVYVRNGDFVQIYLDGDLQISEKSEVVNTNPNDALIIGGDRDDSANFEGRIDELSVFHRALTFDQIAGHLRALGIDARSHLDEGRLDSSSLDPDQSLNAIHVRDGFRVELVASEPLVQDPVAIDWADDGRLWVAEMADYPMGIDGKGKPGGRIRLLRDSNGDGTFDASTIFLDGVSFPNGVMAWGNGVLVTAAPEMFYAEDTDGDDVADVKETLLSGFVEGNQQLRVNGLRWGLDGWVYCASGSHHAGYGATTKIYSAKLGTTFELGSRDFRFRPDTGEFEPVSGPSQFGRVRDDFGNWFGVQNSFPLWHYVLEDRFVKRNPFVSTIDPRRQVRTPRMPRVYSAKPPQKRFHGFEHAGHYTSACGICVYRDDILFPREETHAFTCAPFHNLVQHHVLQVDGTSFHGERAKDGPVDFFASTDRWTRPVMSRTGPDGALWIVDMYRYMIEHPEWLPESARRELEPGYRAGEKLGRIYRVVPAEKSARPVPPVHADDPVQVAKLIAHPNGVVRDLAHRSLLELPNRADAKEAVRALVQVPNRVETRIQAWHVLRQLNEDNVESAAETELLKTLLTDEAAEIRRVAIPSAVRSNNENVQRLLAAMANDNDARVRLQLALSAGDSRNETAGRLLAGLATRADNDRYTTAAIVSSARAHFSVLIRAVTDQENFDDTVFEALVRIGDAEDQLELADLLKPVLSRASADQFGQNLSLRDLYRIQSWLDALAERGTNLELVADQNGPLAAIAKKTMGIINHMRASLAKSDRDAHKLAVCQLLGRQRGQFVIDAEVLASLVAPTESSEIQHQAIQSLSRIANDAAAIELLNAYDAALPSTRASIIETLLNRGRWTSRLLDAIETKEILSRDLTLSQQQRLLNSRDAKIRAKATRLFVVKDGTDTASSKTQLISEYVAKISVGDPIEGEKLFRANCQVCHALDRHERLVGPDLRALTNRSPESLLTAILDPGQSIDPRYLHYQFVLADGRTMNGIVTKEDANAISLQLADGKSQIVARTAIEEAHALNTSLMPNGFESRLNPDDMSDLIAFVQSL